MSGRRAGVQPKAGSRPDAVNGVHPDAMDHSRAAGKKRHGQARSVQPGSHAVPPERGEPDGGIEGPAADARRRKRKSGRRRNQGKQGHGAGDAMRGLRPAIQPAPDAAFLPPPQQGTVREPYRARPAQQPEAEGGDRLYAALDLGTNNCRLLVAAPVERGRFRVIDGFSRIVRLGEGLGRTGALSQQAMERALDALAICAQKLGSHSIEGQRLIATEACRQAENGALFLERIEERTGLKLEIIDRKTEAYLAAEGCGALMDRQAEAAVLFDIGGGSSELVLVDRTQGRRRISEQIVSWTSLPIGVVTLAERHGGEEVDPELFERMVSEVTEMLAEFGDNPRFRSLWQPGRAHLLGTSGTVTTLAGVHLRLPRYDRRRVDGLWMSAGEIDGIISELLSMDYEARAASPCVGRERADLVLAGCAILEAIRRVWPSERLRVADRGLREGILTQLMENDPRWRAPRGKRNRGQAQGAHGWRTRNG